MTSPNQILEMHNWEREPHLSERSRFWLWLIRENSTPEADKRSIVKTLINRANQSADPMEKGEILVHCSLYFLEREQCDDALGILRQVRDLYQQQWDSHHQATTEWLIHKVYHQQGDYRTAFTWALETRKVFESFAQMRAKQHDRLQENWYKQRVTDITCDLVLVQQYVFEWMNKFHSAPTRLSPSARKIQMDAALMMSSRRFVEMEEKMSLLLSMTRQREDLYQYAESWVFQGLCCLEAGKRREAVHAFQSGLANYPPRSHEHAHTRWMLGLTLFEDPDHLHDAINNMEMSLADFDALCTTADHQNRIDDCAWYTQQREGMHAALKRLVDTRH